VKAFNHVRSQLSAVSSVRSSLAFRARKVNERVRVREERERERERESERERERESLVATFDDNSFEIHYKDRRQLRHSLLLGSSLDQRIRSIWSGSSPLLRLCSNFAPFPLDKFAVLVRISFEALPIIITARHSAPEGRSLYRLSLLESAQHLLPRNRLFVKRYIITLEANLV
jgi:hypothetical protein